MVDKELQEGRHPIASIPQLDIFCWNDVEELGDLERLELILRHLPDEPLMQAMERQRGNGRNEYSIRAVWNSILAGIVFGHPSIASLRRELLRNAQLRRPKADTALVGRLSDKADNRHSPYVAGLG